MFEEYIEILKTNPVFYNVSEKDLNDMLEYLKPIIKHFQKGEFIVKKGDPFNGIGFVIEGEVILSNNNSSGDNIIMNRIFKGNMFGEVFAFSKLSKWPLGAKADTNVKILFIDTKSILNVWNKDFKWTKHILTNFLLLLSNRAMYLKYKLDILSIKSMRGKISKFFLFKYYKSNKTTFNIKYNRQEFADFLQVSRPSMSRELSKMKKEGIIDYYKNTFKLLDLEKLQKNL